MKQPSPLVVDQYNQFIYPSSSQLSTTIRNNQTISVCCPGNNVVYQGNVLNTTCVNLSCLHSTQFYSLDQEVDFGDFTCRDIPEDVIQYTRKSCLEGGQEIEIGYDLGNGRFIRQIKVCFDPVVHSPIYSHFNLTRNIGYRDSKVPRKFFEENGFYAVSSSLDTLYRRDRERQTINDLLQLDRKSNQYIKSNGELFINRGHLTAKGDFVYSFQQLATFHYVNSAPQWASFNGGNWNELEISLREYAHSRNEDLEVYTGIHGITALPHAKTGRKTELFLHTLNDRKLLPIPRLFWKVIYNRKHAKGIAILGVNNPYDIDLSDDVICPDISDQVGWFDDKLKKQRKNLELGYTYACSVPDFQRISRNVPNLNVSSLLI